jgi:hypothetical protein
MPLDSSVTDLWGDLYHLMETGDDLPGIAGHLLARGPAQTLRLALLYALLDGADAISEAHLTAGYALWRYSENSVRHLFGDRLGDPLAQRLLNAVRAAGWDGLTGRGMHDALGRNVKAEQINAATNLLVRFNLVERVSEGSTPRGGRPAIRFRAVTSTRANPSKPWTGAG